LRLKELAERLGCELRGDGAVEVARVRGLEDAGPGDLTFLANPKYASQLVTTQAAAVIVSPDLMTSLPALLSPNPYLTFARAVGVLHPQPRPAPGIHPAAQVDPTAVVDPSASIGPLAVVGARVRIGARTILHPHVVLYPDVAVGSDCLLHSGVQVRERCQIGERVILQNGVVVGGDGFGFAKDGARYEKIPQVGIVVIEDDVEVGAGSTIDRAALGETRIGRGTKIDNLVQIAHSVKIGCDSVIVAQVGIAGSTTLGDRVTLAGQVGVVGHITIGDDVIATAQAGVAHSLPSGSIVSGSPAFETAVWRRSVAVFAKLPELLKRVRDLEKRLGKSSTE
jgi:UDP-3-O-[3-hydroxymyristoyl] glucosamine N-acyltransferase